MRRYGDPPDDQMSLELPGLTDGGMELMAEARKWAAVHYDEWMWYRRFAGRECEGGRKASPNFCLQAMRRRFKCEVPNAYAPCFARMAMEQDSSLSFRVARSKVDGFTTAVLR